MQQHQHPYRYSLVLQTPYFNPKYLTIHQAARYFNADFDNNGLFLSSVYVSDIIHSNEGEKSILTWAINFIIKSIRKRIEIPAKSLFSCFVIVFNTKFLVLLFMRKSICQGRENCLVHYIQVTGYTFYRIVFQTMYASKIGMYLSLKGIGKILLVSVLRILLISKTLKFRATFNNKIKVS